MSSTTFTSVNENLIDQFSTVRSFTDKIVESLSPEDCMVQAMDDASPTRWHLAHTTWFFETFILRQERSYSPFQEEFKYLFNSYYNAIGKQFPRPRRGTISRPGLDEIKQYREYVDGEIKSRLESREFCERMRDVLLVGLNHEQQHQELILTDIKYALSCNPMMPKYRNVAFDKSDPAAERWVGISEGIYEIGHRGDRFCFDNESPQHQVFLQPFSISSRLVTCGQFIEFIEDGGYRRPEYWLALGWNTVNECGWDAPLYWVKRNGEWLHFTLAGLAPVNMDWPVCHVSYFEADAFSRWLGNRLPTEQEWEVACCQATRELEPAANEPFVEYMTANDLAIHSTRSPQRMLGGLWQWTSSSYSPFPGYAAPDGAIGEYNGKFMCNQYVLRGGSVATSRLHIRPTYRNFFSPESRWQFSGIRLAR